MKSYHIKILLPINHKKLTMIQLQSLIKKKVQLIKHVVITLYRQIK